jgi:Zn-dependent M16 (insulinase) family peptidase
MVFEEKSSMEAGLIPSGHRVINNRLKAQFDEAAWATEQMSGIDYLFFIRKLADSFDQLWESTLSIFHTIRDLLIQQSNLVCNFTIEAAEKATVLNSLSEFLKKLPDKPVQLKNWQPEKMDTNEGLTIPSQVNYVGKGANLYQLGYQHHGSINVINQYLCSTWLWEKIRVQGGAYGGFSSFDRLSGMYNFLSYRDPNLLETLENYDLTANFLKNLNLGETELTKSIIGAIGEVDSYMLPDAKGYTAMLRYLLGISDEERQMIRDQILNSTEEDFHRFGEILENLNKNGSIIVLGSADSIQKANAEKDQFLKVKQVL